MKVLVIPENRDLDQYILKPVVERLFRDLGRKARIEVLPNPPIHGVSQALDGQVVGRIIQQNPMVELFLLIVDRDGDVNRERGPLAARERQALNQGRTLIGCLAVEEVEVWALALHRRELKVDWGAVRSERDPKEVYFEPLVKRMDWLKSPGRGRSAAMKALRGNWQSLKSQCPELAVFQDRIADLLAAQSQA